MVLQEKILVVLRFGGDGTWSRKYSLHLKLLSQRIAKLESSRRTCIDNKMQQVGGMLVNESPLSKLAKSVNTLHYIKWCNIVLHLSENAHYIP